AAYTRLAAAQVLAQPHDAVVGGRLDRLATHARDVLRHGIEHADREPTRQASGELPRAEDAGKGGRDVVVVGARQLRRAPDAPGVDQPFAVAVHLIAIDVELEQPASRDEEGPLLPEERLERAEVQDGG